MAEQPQQQTEADRQRIADLAVALAALTAAAAAPGALLVLAPLGIPRWVVTAVLRFVYEVDVDRVAGFGAAGQAAERQALLHRAAYVLAAARRVDRARLSAASGTTGGTERQAVADAVARERRYYELHRAAEVNRRQVAANVDFAAMSYGPVLGWVAVLDDRTSVECRAAHGGRFAAADPPVIGYPGAVHPHCRCRPGPARAGALTVNQKLAAAGLLGRAAA